MTQIFCWTKLNKQFLESLTKQFLEIIFDLEDIFGDLEGIYLHHRRFRWVFSDFSNRTLINCSILSLPIGAHLGDHIHSRYYKKVRMLRYHYSGTFWKTFINQKYGFLLFFTIGSLPYKISSHILKVHTDSKSSDFRVCVFFFFFFPFWKVKFIEDFSFVLVG